MLTIKNAAPELNRLLLAAQEAEIEYSGNEILAEKNAQDLAEAFGWRREDSTWKSAEEFSEWKEKRVDVTPNFVRVRVKSREDFTAGSFRFLTLDKSRGIRELIGRLKGKTTTARQSLVFDRKKDWTAPSAEEWARDNGTAPV